MNKYHILVNDIQKGPFSKEELKNLELSKSTLVWFRELKDWTEIQDIEELKSLIENRPPPIPKKPDKNELVKKETAKQIVNVFKLIKTSLLLGIMLLIGYAIYSNLISYSLFDKKFHASEAEKILGYLPREYVFKETSREGYFGPAYGSMVITDSGEKKVKSLIINQLIENTIVFTLIMIGLTFAIMLVYYYTKRGVQWTKRYSS